MRGETTDTLHAYVSPDETGVRLCSAPEKQTGAQASQLLPWIPTLQKMGQSRCTKNLRCLPFPRWLGKGKATFWKVDGCQVLDTTWRFLFYYFSVNKSLWADLCSPSLRLSLSPLPFLPFSSQAVSINKAINTQEVAVKEKHARNILIVRVCVWERGRSVFILISMYVCVAIPPWL